MEMNEESILAWNIIEKTNANLFLTGKRLETIPACYSLGRCCSGFCLYAIITG